MKILSLLVYIKQMWTMPKTGWPHISFLTGTLSYANSSSSQAEGDSNVATLSTTSMGQLRRMPEVVPVGPKERMNLGLRI